jgi:hypothetical protein
MAILFACALAVVLGGGLLWWQQRAGATPAVVAVEPTAEGQPTATPTVESTPTLHATAMPEPTAVPPTATSTPLPTPTATPVVENVAPVSEPLQPPDPQRAALVDPGGYVEMQEADGDWEIVPSEGAILAAESRVRTGRLSSASLVFYDGSVTHLGPDSELSVNELDAQREGGPRVVVLTQWAGESDHDVAPSADGESRYQVDTPSGSGAARGTAFHVRVMPSGVVHFKVHKGLVAVTHVEVTVLVVAGQWAAVEPGQPPGDPVFRVTGEGEVEDTGAQWKIGGQTFDTHEATVIVGNPQVGDWVSVEGRLLDDGTRVADRIALLHRATENRFVLQGRLDTLGDQEWIVAGHSITPADGLEVPEEIEEETLVQVEGIILEDGTLLGQGIEAIEETPGRPFRFVGVVQDREGTAWSISNVAIRLDDDTEWDEALAVGDVVTVRGWVLADGTWLATSIEGVAPHLGPFEFAGRVESKFPNWQVGGISLETRPWTEVWGQIEVGDLVRVKGYVLGDGAWLAVEIASLEEDQDLPYVAFVGTVVGRDPWVVSGVTLVIDEDTQDPGEIPVGTLVRVKAEILPGGTLALREMRPVDLPFGRGCMQLSAIVLSLEGQRLALRNGVTLSLNEAVYVRGEIAVNSVVWLDVCVNWEGRMAVTGVAFLYQIDPAIVPLPPLPQPVIVVPLSPPSPDEEVTICHKPGTPAEQTMRVTRSALPAHLAHGDRPGRCK